MFFRAMCIAFLACISLAGFADSPSDTVTIPLKDIWAWRMPGTKDVRELDGPEKRPAQKIADQLRLAPSDQPPQYKLTDAGKAFAVVGSPGKETLKAAYSVFVDKQNPQQIFLPTDNISIVFFSLQSGIYVRIQKVERHNNTIEIQYSFVPHETAEVTEHFALIPLGELPSGQYQVQIKQLPLDQKFLDQGFKEIGKEWVQRLVCKPFSFSVQTNEAGYANSIGMTTAELSLFGDVNGDGHFNNADLQALLNYLKAGNGSTSVPEPASLVLLAMGGVVSLAGRRKSGAGK